MGFKARATGEDMFIGKKCIIRSRDSGVHFGTVVSYSGREVILKDSRRLWYWGAAKGHTLSAVANYGLRDGSKLPAAVELLLVSDMCEILPVTEVAAESIENYPEHLPK